MYDKEGCKKAGRGGGDLRPHRQETIFFFFFFLFFEKWFNGPGEPPPPGFNREKKFFKTVSVLLDKVGKGAYDCKVYILSRL